MQGTIKKILDQRGFGFINSEDHEQDLFFHKKSVSGTLIFEDLKEGQAITFDVEDTPKGPQAVNIEKA